MMKQEIAMQDKYKQHRKDRLTQMHSLTEVIVSRKLPFPLVT